VHSIECDQILDDATSVMASTGASLLIVTKQGQPVGILTARDLALAPKRCETCLPATIRVTNGEGEGAKHLATIRQLSHVGAFIESRTLLLPGTSIVLSFMLPGTDLSFSLRGTILNSSYEPEFHEDRDALGTYPGVDIQFAPLPSSDESKIRAWVLQNLPRASGLS
ncbi:MAG: PilZ domain-containing protein, partial [Nitrospira sp.]|nr:PilZ domain-containing protein [Nitrospira sp.]